MTPLTAPRCVIHRWERVVPLLPWRRVHDRCVFCGEVQG